jgi:hypothetical protein
MRRQPANRSFRIALLKKLCSAAIPANRAFMRTDECADQNAPAEGSDGLVPMMSSLASSEGCA